MPPLHLLCCGRRGVVPQRHLTEGAQEPRLGQTKTFRKDSEASLRAERWRGYVILFSNEPSCCYVATSERRRIRLKADFHYFALRGASIRRSQRSNSEAVLFRGTLPRRCSIKRSRWDNASPDHYPLTISSAYLFNALFGTLHHARRYTFVLATIFDTHAHNHNT